MLAGPGNNGGDARIVARSLKEQFFRVRSPSAATSCRTSRWALVVDGLFGIGLARASPGATPRSSLRQPPAPARCSRSTCRAASSPTPVGCSAARCAPRTPSPSSRSSRGCSRSTARTTAARSTSRRSGSMRALPHAAHGWRPGALQRALKTRPRNFHKGMAGSLGVLGGAAGMAGAALLAGRAALKLGAGRVYVGLLDERSLDSTAGAELMLRHPDDVLGPGPRRARRRPGARPGRARRDAGRRGARERPAVRARRRRAQPDRGERGSARGLRAAQRRHAAHAASGRSRAAARLDHRRRAERSGEAARASPPTSTRTSC